MSEWASPESAELFESFAPTFKGDDRLDRMAGLAEMLLNKGLRFDAARLAQMILSESAGPSRATQRARFVLSVDIPRWHFDILCDDARLEAYERAIRETVKPGMLVLDIGTGSGILAMMAARAGAELVVACEREPALALIATTIVAHNGMADRIRVVCKESSALQPGVDLPRKADCVISEVIAADLLGEGVLDTMAAARRDLMADDAPTVPRRGTVHVALVREQRHFPEVLDIVAGYDLSPFNTVMKPSYFCGNIRPDALLSDDAPLFSIDLSGRDARHAEQASAPVRVRETGVAVGILQWIELDLAPGVSLASGPEALSQSWGQSFSPLQTPLPVTAGQTVAIHGWRTSEHLLLWT